MRDERRFVRRNRVLGSEGVRHLHRGGQARAKTKSIVSALKHGGINATHASSCNVGILQVLKALHVGSQSKLLQRKLRIAVRSMRSVVLETVEVLISLPTYFAAVWLLLLHAHRTGIRNGGERVDNGEGTVVVFLELLILVAMLLVVLETVLVLVCLLATNDWTPERLDLLREGELRNTCAIEHLLFTNSAGELALVVTTKLVVLQCRLQLSLVQTATLLAEEALAGLIDCAVVVKGGHSKIAIAEVHVYAVHTIHAIHAHIHTHHRVEVVEVNVKFSWSTRVRRLRRSQIVVLHGHRAERRRIYRRYCGVIVEVELLRR